MRADTHTHRHMHTFDAERGSASASHGWKLETVEARVRAVHTTTTYPFLLVLVHKLTHTRTFAEIRVRPIRIHTHTVVHQFGPISPVQLPFAIITSVFGDAHCVDLHAHTRVSHTKMVLGHIHVWLRAVYAPHTHVSLTLPPLYHPTRHPNGHRHTTTHPFRAGVFNGNDGGGRSLRVRIFARFDIGYMYRAVERGSGVQADDCFAEQASEVSPSCKGGGRCGASIVVSVLPAATETKGLQLLHVHARHDTHTHTTATCNNVHMFMCAHVSACVWICVCLANRYPAGRSYCFRASQETIHHFSSVQCGPIPLIILGTNTNAKDDVRLCDSELLHFSRLLSKCTLVKHLQNILLQRCVTNFRANVMVMMTVPHDGCQ